MNMDNYDTKEYGSNKNIKKVKGLTNDQGLKEYDSVTFNHRICTREYPSCNGDCSKSTDDSHFTTYEYILIPYGTLKNYDISLNQNCNLDFCIVTYIVCISTT